MSEKFDYPATLPELPTVASATRSTRHAEKRKTVEQAFGLVETLNPRLLQNDAVVSDLIWISDAFDRLLGMKASVDNWAALNLPQVGGLNGFTPLLGRLTEKNIAPELLRPLLPAEIAATVPVWEFNGEKLRNPWLPELDGEFEAMADRVLLEAEQPALAALLKLEAAGGPSYRQHFAAIEDGRLAEQARAYNGPNPYVRPQGQQLLGREDQTRNAMLAAISRQNRILAEQLKAEAEIRGVNPFGSHANLTKQMLAFKADQSLAFVLQAAGDLEGRQLAAEAREAELAAEDAQRKAAELSAARNRRSLGR